MIILPLGFVNSFFRPRNCPELGKEPVIGLYKPALRYEEKISCRGAIICGREGGESSGISIGGCGSVQHIIFVISLVEYFNW